MANNRVSSWQSFLAVLTLVVVALTQLVSPVQAQKIIPVDDGKFYQVKEGVFQIKERQAVDLTDRHLLFTFRRSGRECRKEQCIVCVLNGNSTACDIGKRFDLKWANAPFYLKGTFADRRECVLDVVNFKKPKGAPATAVFRIRCI